jgi:DNA-binding HxlR family transcriptional regulator
MVGDDGLDFISQLKGMVNKITDKMLARRVSR